MLWELMKAQRTGVYPDLRTKYIAEAFKNTSSKITEMSGALPLAFVTTGLPLTNYKPYGNAVQAATPSPDNPVEMQACGDKTANLFDYITQAGDMTDVAHTAIRDTYLKSDGSFVTLSGWFVSDYIEIIGDFVTVSNIGGNVPAICVYDENKNFIRGKSYNTGGSTKLGSCTIDATGAKYVRFSFVHSTMGVIAMLNEGETALPYEPYGYKIPFTTAAEDGSESITTTVYLDKPLYKIGDYADSLSYAEQKVERYIKEMILTGDEKWSKSNTYKGSFYARVLADLHSPFDDAYCSHAIQTKALSTYTYGEFYLENTTSYVLNLFIGQPEWTVAEFKAWLKEQYAAGTPVKVWYVLQTPETESVELPKLPTLDGVTVIDAATEIKPSKMDIKYTEQRLMMFARRD